MLEIDHIKKVVLPILKKNGVIKAGIFGSVARGESKKSSDVDILIRYKGRKSLLDLIGLEMELEEALSKKVDLVTYNSLHHLIKDEIMNDEVDIFA
jgi:predicted nucleotidyltransferase